MRGFLVAAVGFAPRALRAVNRTLLVAAASLVTATDLSAQTSPTIWNSYDGSQSVPISFSTNASPGVSPAISLSVGGGTANFTFDTGSTGIEVTESTFCKNNSSQCTNGKFTDTGSILGYAKITLSSSGATASGFYVNTTVTINSGGTAMATATVPVLVGGTFNQAGVGFGRPETANGLQLYTDSSLNTLNGTTLYGRALNPLVNLTQLNIGSGLAAISSSIAPGYVVTSQAVYLGLSQSPTGGARVALTALPQPASGASTYASSTYAQNATKFDWQTPPMLMQVSNNSAGLNGNYYGNVVVDTGLAVGIITNGTTCTIAGTQTGCVNQALVQSATQSATPTRIAITLGGAGASGNPAAQFIYVFQGVCPNGASGCGPPPQAAIAERRRRSTARRRRC